MFMKAREPQVLIAANRLPLTAHRQGGRLQITPSAGGVACGLRDLAQHWPVQWFGWSGLHARGADDSMAGQLKLATARLAQGTIVDVPLTEKEVEHYYRRYCNTLLWPALHGWLGEPEVSATDWAVYQQINARYAQAIAARLQEDDRVWIHDYHLLLLPDLLRAQVPGVSAAFFLHTPFPAAHEFLAIREARQLITGMLGADVVGFHTAEYASNFLACAQQLGFRVRGNEIDTGSRVVAVKTSPMGVNAGVFSTLAENDRVQAEVIRLRKRSGSFMLGVDRLDYIKGIPEKLIAFECLLERHEELHGNVSLIQIAVPTRAEIPAYRDLRQVVEAIVARINRNFGSAGWTPVDYFYGTVEMETLVSLYRAADVLLVTSQRDGLNLVAKEFVASRTDEDGVLILSRFAGAAHEMDAAIQVNPRRYSELADAYYNALTMPATERRLRMRRLRTSIESNGVVRWAAEFLGAVPIAAQRCALAL